MATAARIAPAPSALPAPAAAPNPGSSARAEVAEVAWEAGEWVEVERVRLAPVIALDDYRSGSQGAGRRPPARVTAWLGAAAVAVLLALTAGGRFADAGPVDPAAGQVVVTPGDTLWDVAVANAPEGVDPRAYLARIRELNDLSSAAVPAWTVVLLPHA